MTSPAVFVLFLAHAYAILDTVSDAQLDPDTGLTNNPVMNLYKKHNPWTNIYDESNTELRKHVNTNINNNILKEIYIENEEITRNFDIHKMNVRKIEAAYKFRKFNESEIAKRRVKREVSDPRCEAFLYNGRDTMITHPHAKNNSNYYNNTDCVTVINATDGRVIELTFVHVFRIEYHPECSYDYLEIRDGLKGYSKLIDRVCGQAFPRQMTTSGPNVWMKFHSDDTIEYEGFQIDIKFKQAAVSQSIPETCYKTIEGRSGEINSSNIDPLCKSGSQNLDVLWTIKTPENTKIYLNFTKYDLAKPNECEENVIEVYGSVLEVSARLVQYCGSMANPISTKESKDAKDDIGNIMYVRLYASKSAKNLTSFTATFTAYRSLNPAKDEKCDPDDEFDCDDNTCIDGSLLCDDIAHCRLKTDEDSERCKTVTKSTISEPHIMVILIIFCLILSMMSFVFLFKCIKKLYEDHKIIKEHISQSCEDRLDTLVERRLTLDAQRLARDSEPRASLERENHANEMYKRKKESFSKRKPTSIDSEFIQETQLDLDEEPWRRDVDSSPDEPEGIRPDRNGRTRRSDMSRREENIRSKRGSEVKKENKKENRDVSVGAPDTKESSCQTRESLFQTDPPPSSDGSGTNSRGFSTFGYSGATIVRPSPPAPTNTSEITIELLRQVPRQDSVKPQKKIDRRPISTETTRSAPDVIIVSKPIR